MTIMKLPFVRGIERVQRRFVRARPGSVLILVVALLVLMALIGTAFMTMAQSDRATTVQHSFNTEIDLLLDGLISTVKGNLSNELFAQGQFRPAPGLTNPSGYPHTTSVGVDVAATAHYPNNPAKGSYAPYAASVYLADRVPNVDSLVDAGGTPIPGVLVGSTPPGNTIYWRFIGAPLIGTQYESPFWTSATSPNIWLRDIPTTAAAPAGPGQNGRMAPTSVTLNGTVYPALVMLGSNGFPVSAPLLAADVDGDGTADAALFKLPIGTLDGITYYAATRIVDNCAAINPNLAFMPNSGGGSLPPGDFFPSNVNLFGMLTGPGGGRTIYDQQQLVPPGPPMPTPIPANYLIYYLFNSNLTPAQAPSGILPYDDFGIQRSDFSYSGTVSDALWLQLGRRLNNPGLAAPGVPFQALPITESMALANRFCIYDSTVTPSLLEGWLKDATVNLSPTKPYVADQVVNWFNQNFYYAINHPTFAPPANYSQPYMPYRAILAPQNPVSSFVPSKLFAAGTVDYTASTVVFPPGSGTGGAYQFGDMVTVKSAAGTRAYTYIAPANAPAAPQPGTASAWAGWFWAPEPWNTAPTKVSVRSGTFTQLLTGYWQVMADRTNVLGVPVNTAVAPITPIQQFSSPIRDPDQVAPAVVTNPPTRDQNQTIFLKPSEVIKLRAAQAAINTVALRQAGVTPTAGGTAQEYDVPSDRIFLNDGSGVSGGRLIEATVYGYQPQPFIATAYAENDSDTKDSDTPAGPAGGGGPPANNPQGYVGVLLFNPYPFDIDITNWQLGIIQGRASNSDPNNAAVYGTAAPPAPDTYSNMQLTKIPGFTGFTTTGAGNTTVIPKGQYLLIENYPGTGGAAGPNDAHFRPKAIRPIGAAVVKSYFVSDLSMVMTDKNNPNGQPGGELVLLRPRKASLSGAGGSQVMSSTLSTVTGKYNESANLADLVPVDSFDFFGMTILPPGGTQYNGIYYTRTSAATGNNAWKCVFPGRWSASRTRSGAPYRQEGISVGTWKVGAGITDPDLPPNAAWTPKPPLPWGQANTTATYTNNFPPIQLTNTGFPAPDPVKAGATNLFPFGNFARNGDILQVPYIGAYRLRVVTGLDNNGDALPAVQPAQAAGIVTPNAPVTNLIELNPISMDAQQADDYDSSTAVGTPDDKFENIGRFCPIDGVDTTYSPDDFAQPLGGATASPLWRYHWAMQLFDYLTVHSPQDDQFPLVDSSYAASDPTTTPAGHMPQPVLHGAAALSTPGPQTYGQLLAAGSTTSLTQVSATLATAANYVNLPLMMLTGIDEGQIVLIRNVRRVGPGGREWQINLTGTGLTQAPQKGDQFVILGNAEETAATNGLVNVNTASWRVLAAVPFIDSAATTKAPLNNQIAASIVYYRDVGDVSQPGGPPHGPFKSLFELNKVPILGPDFTTYAGYTFRDVLHQAAGSSQTTDFNNTDGDLTPLGGMDGITGDFEGTFLAMNRVSNLLTTHSDSFTAYILVQGWRNAETVNPTLVVQRRVAVIIDRSMVTPQNKSPNSITIPIN